MILSGYEKVLDEALRHCESEPIHIPGNIQPHGVLLGIDPLSFKVTLATENVEEYLGRSPEQTLGSDLARVIGGAMKDRIEHLAAYDDLSRPRRFLAAIESAGTEWLAEASLHRLGPSLILELERADSAGVEAAIELSTWIHRFSNAAGKPGSLVQFFQSIAEEVRELSGYDRTMVYRFHPDDHGEVIAESVRADLDPYLGLHYPASDIPRQARELYLRSRVRVLADVHARSVPLSMKEGLSPAGPFDMTFCQLRSFSPVHLEYLDNMGVHASLVTSILQGDRLWGLLVCHHYGAPRKPSHAVRAACDFLSELISAEVVALESRDQLQAQHAASDVQKRILATVVDDTDWMDAILARPDPCETPIQANGMAIVEGTTIRSVGTVPGEATIREICAWVARNRQGPIFSTDALGESEPLFADMATASGILAVEIGPALRTHLIWFRQELIREVHWGGDPRKGLVVDEEGARLSPRKSFDAWNATILGRSAPWGNGDLTVAREIRASVIEVVMLASLLEKTDAEIELVRTRRAVEASSEAILIADDKGRPTLVNRAFVDLFHAGLDELPARSVCAPIANPAFGKEILAATLGSGGSWRGEVEVARPGGGPIPVALGIDSVINEAGVVLGFIAIHFDLTGRRRARLELEEHSRRLEAARVEIEQQSLLLADAKGRAEAANRAKSDFLANMCHEIRTPMNGVIGLSELLLETKLDDVQLSYATTIRSSGDALMTLVTDILDLSKIEAGKMIIVSADFDPRELLKELVALLKPTAQQKGIRLTANLSIDFPPKLRGDVVRIRQIMTNLAGNAIKFTDHGEVTISGETILLTPTGATIRIAVKDTGAGIAAAMQKSIFESFTQGEVGNARAATGSGLGLTICRNLADLLGGHVEFVSEEGRGSTFWLELTLALPAGLPDTPAVPRVEANPGSSRPARRLRVLVADDNSANQMVLVGLIGLIGHEAEVVANGREAVEAHAREAFDMILLDLEMPEMDGYAAAAEIRLRELRGGSSVRRTTIIAATAYAMEEERRRCLESGMDAFITKPITTGALRSAFDRFG